MERKWNSLSRKGEVQPTVGCNDTPRERERERERCEISEICIFINQNATAPFLTATYFERCLCRIWIV